MQFPGRQTTNMTHSKSLESPSERAVRKTHLRNRPQTEFPTSSSEDERSEIDKRITRPPAPPSCTYVQLLECRRLKDMEQEMMQLNDTFRGALVVVVAASARSPRHSPNVAPQSESHAWRTASLTRHEEMDLHVKFKKRANRAHLAAKATDFIPLLNERGDSQKNCSPGAVWSFVMMRWCANVKAVACVSAAERKKTSDANASGWI